MKRNKRFFAILLVISMLAGIFPVSGRAAEEEYIFSSGNIGHTSYDFIHVNPEYEHLPLNLPDAPDDSLDLTGEIKTVATFSDAAAYLREQMAAREETIVVSILDYTYVDDEQVSDDWNAILSEAFEHTGEPTCGDYLDRHYGGCGGSYSLNNTTLTLTYAVSYYTTAEQEAEMNVAVEELLDDLNAEYGIYSAADYDKVRIIYDYICDNVRYDRANPDTYDLKYTAYAALINKTAVCQGYSSLFYRLALSLGVDARYIRGYAAGGNHGWNIVDMGDYYYYLDATWDEGKEFFDYFLIGSDQFLTDHTPREEYLTAEFAAQYPIDTKNYIRPNDPVLFSGKCGENVNWSLSFNGVLTISGEGAMSTYTSTDDLPWTDNRSDIKELVVSEGITSLTHLVCCGCTNLKTVTLPASLTSIGQKAFEYCESLTTVRYGGTREQWDNLSVNIDNDPLLNAELWCGITRDPVTHTLTDPEGLYALYTSEAVQNGDTIEIETSADVNEINGNDPWVMDKAVTIKGGKLTLRPGGILLGADVTFDGVTLVFANRVRNAIMANGHTLILEDVQYDTSANAVHLFCGGMTGSDVSADSGNHGKIIIRGNTSLGNIYAGSISSDGVENTFDMPATILVSSSAAGSMGTLFACGALETYVPDNEMLNPNYVVAPPTASAESFKVSGEVTIELQQRVVKTVDGTTGGETNAAVIYNGNGYACELTLTNLSSLSVESGNLIPVDSSMNGDVSVAGGACLTLSGFGDTLTVGNFTGGGDIVLDEEQTLRITGDVSGVTRVGIGGIFEDKSQGTFANEHIYIVAPKSNDSSFVLLPFDFDPSAVFERDVDGNWTILATETEKIVIESAAMEDEYRVGADEQLGSVTIPVTVSFSSNPEFSCLSEVPAVLSINGETAQMEHDEYGYYYSFGESSVFCTAYFTYVDDCDVLYIEGVDVIPTGRYVITVIIPAEYMAGGYDLPLATFLIVGETEPEEPDSPIVIACGACGENLEWVLNSDGVLTISGEGEMYGYDICGAPWDSERSAITEVIIGDSVTSIGAFVFYGCNSLTSVEIPNSVVSLGESAFAGCNNLNSVTIGNGVTSIDDNAFHGCNSLSTVNYTDTEQMWKMIKVGDGNEALKNAAITYLFGHEHSDSNLDHICDGNCGKTDIGAHADSATDADHVCDYGCGAVMEECSDAMGDKNHACDICGAVNISEHSWVDATCAAPKTCSECGATEGEALEHIDENKDHKCDNDCGKTDIGTHADSDKNHACDYGCTTTIGDHIDSNTDADHVCDYGCGVALEECSDAMGDKNHACDVCGAVNVSEHSWGDATCKAPKTCSECGATEGEALEHIDENKDHKCDYDCGKTDIGAHADSATDADHVCDYGCGAVLEECSDAMGDKNHACDICGAVNVSGHSWDDATCKAPKTCSECGATEGEKLAHTEEIVPGKAATCTEDGLTDGKRCIVCGEVTVEQTVVPAPGHAEEIVPGTEATLTTPGLTEGKKCSVCDEILVEQKEIPTLEFITGKCGEDLTWTLTKDGVLTISGTGAMFNFKIIIDLLPLNAVPMSEVDLEAAPWIDYTALITKVVIEGGVTSIGDNAFAACENLVEVEIPNTVTEIGDDVFTGCEALEIVTYSGSQEQWDEIKIGEGNEMMDGKIEANANSVKKGDVNGDGNVNGRDTIIIATAIANRATQDFTPEQFKAADVNGDGSVNGRDTIIIATAIANRTTDEL